MENVVKDENELLLLNEKGSFKKQESNSLRNTYFSPLAPGSLRASIFALVCVTLGSGMLPLPYFFRKNGIFESLIIFLFCGFCTLFTLKILLELAHKNKTYVYNDLVGIYFNNNYMVTYSIIVLLINSLGSIIAWNVIILNFLKEIFKYFNIYHENYPYYISLLILCFILIPISTYQTISKFYIVSTIGIIQILYVVLVVLLEFPMYFKEHLRNWELNVKFFHHFNFLSVIEMHLNFIIAFGNHSTLLSVVYEIKNKTKNRVMEVGEGTFYSELFIYLIIMFFSYFSTFNHTKNVFLDRPHHTILLLFAQFFMITLMICNILLYYYMLIPMLQIFFNKNKVFTLLENFFYSCIVLTILIVISFYINNIVNIFSFIGASAQVSFIFIIPLSVYIKANPKMNKFKKIVIILEIGYFTFIGLMFFIYYFKKYINDMFSIKIKQ